MSPSYNSQHQSPLPQPLPQRPLRTHPEQKVLSPTSPFGYAECTYAFPVTENFIIGRCFHKQRLIFLQFQKLQSILNVAQKCARKSSKKRGYWVLSGLIRNGTVRRKPPRPVSSSFCLMVWTAPPNRHHNVP